jgi:F-type H+-transporting ATPase subunit epsilon
VRIHHDGTVGTATIDGGFLSVNNDVVTIVAEDVDASQLGA